MFRALLVKELRELLLSPVTYLVMVPAVIVQNWAFYHLFGDFLQNQGQIRDLDQALATRVIFSYIGNVHFLLLLYIPIIFGRSWSEERRQSTLVMLLHSRANLTLIITAKYLAACTVLALMLLPAMAPFGILRSIGHSELWPIVSSVVALGLAGMMYGAWVCFISTFTASLGVASVVSVLLILFFMMLPMASKVLSSLTLVELFRYLGVSVHFEKIARGLFSLEDFVYFALHIGFALFLTYQSLRYRGLKSC